MRSAALANSVSAQVLEFEDWVGVVHTGATVVPTALAVAEAVAASGRDLLTAIVAGNEIAARVGSATFGGRGGGNAHAVHQVETPLIAGKLLGLSPTQLMDAVGGSCAQAQFPAIISWTSHSKGYLTGWPVYCGVTAALVARHGFTGNHEIVEHPKGYCVEAQGICRPEQLTQGLGEHWYLADAYTNKPYPMCGFTMAPADCLLDLVREHDIKPEDVERIEVRCPVTFIITGTWWETVPDLYDRIRDGENSGWSWVPLLFDARYPLAAGLVDREITPRQFTRERIFDQRIQQQLAKIELQHDPELDARLALGQGFGAAVTIALQDGRRVSREVDDHRGGPANPIDAREKFRIATRDALADSRREAIIEAIERVESMPDVRELGKAL
jgi:2-methylcitrate dehydratase PrpD